MDEIQRGQSADRFLSDPLVQEAIEAVQQDIIELWRVTSASAQREELWLTLKNLERVVSKIETFRGEFLTYAAEQEIEDGTN